MKKEMLLSSIIASALVTPGSNVWAMDPSTDFVATVVRDRLASATVYTQKNVKDFEGVKDGSTVSVYFMDASENDFYDRVPGDLEMMIRVTDPEGKIKEQHGNGSMHDVHFYLRPHKTRDNIKTYLGFTSNSSCYGELGQTFFVDLDDSTQSMSIYPGYYENLGSYMPSFVSNLKAIKQ